MFSYELIQTYMRAKNYTQTKQAAIDLGFSDAYLSNVKTGKKKLSEESAIYIAKRCEMDVEETLIKLQIEKAKTEAEKSAWTTLLEKFTHGIKSTNTITFIGLLTLCPSLHDFALCKVMSKLLFSLKNPKMYFFGHLNEKTQPNS